MKHHSIRPWYRSLTLILGAFVTTAILWSWVDSRYHRVEVSTGGAAGLWALNNRSAIAVGFWTNDVRSPGAPEFRVSERSPDYWTWVRRFEVTRDSYRNGHTVCVPHYILIIGWLIALSLALAGRQLWIRRRTRGAEQTIPAQP